jgi:hypothetical protein
MPTENMPVVDGRNHVCGRSVLNWSWLKMTNNCSKGQSTLTICGSPCLDAAKFAARDPSAVTYITAGNAITGLKTCKDLPTYSVPTELSLIQLSKTWDNHTRSGIWHYVMTVGCSLPVNLASCDMSNATLIIGARASCASCLWVATSLLNCSM